MKNKSREKAHPRQRRIFDLEHRRQPLLSRRAFAKRLALSCSVAAGLTAVSLLVGMVGYRHFEQMAWIDAFANAAMILSGMGPLTELHSYGGKLFAGFYALYSGLALILATGLIFGPVVHRLLHRFHIDADESAGGEKSGKEG